MYFIFKPRAVVAALATCALSTLSLSAQQTLPTQQIKGAHEAAPVPAASAVQRASAVSIDGKLDEEAWRAATPITELRQTRPGEGNPSVPRLKPDAFLSTAWRAKYAFIFFTSALLSS